jgi:hypothetical protein
MSRERSDRRRPTNGCTLENVGAVSEAIQIAVCVLISIAALVPLVIVWRDDHRWLDRTRL